MAIFGNREFAIVCLLVTSGPAMAQVELLDGSRVPFAVVKDDTGELIGPVVGFNGKFPRVPLQVGGDTVIVLPTIRGEFLTETTVWFTEADCSGTVGLIPNEETGDGGFYAMQGRYYAIGPGNVLYGDTGGPASSRSVASSWIMGACENFSDTVLLRDAEPVEDLDDLYAPPFHVQ